MIEVQEFKKTFYVGFLRKPFQAAKKISFQVEAGEIFGFLGPNGAGKTTTIKALLGLIRPDAGSLKILGHDSNSMAWRAQVGYMPEHPTFYDFLSGREIVSWFGRLSGMTRHEADKEADKHLSRVGLSHALDRRLRGYSKGMVQRTGLAAAMVSSPKLLILDEPMTGLDPIGRKDIRELILGLRDEGRTIFYSTHILPDVEMTCDRVSIIHRGETRRTGRLEDILTETTRGISVGVRGLSEEKTSQMQEKLTESVVKDGVLAAEFEQLQEAQRFVAEVTQAGAELVRFEPHRDDLESIFVRSLGKSEEKQA